LATLRAELVSMAEIQPGDRVAFPYTAGTVLEADGVRHLLMNEDQVVAILERGGA
jgi:co-chaperonin GroES (HSP10)